MAHLSIRFRTVRGSSSGRQEVGTGKVRFFLSVHSLGVSIQVENFVIDVTLKHDTLLKKTLVNINLSQLRRDLNDSLIIIEILFSQTNYLYAEI